MWETCPLKLLVADTQGAVWLVLCTGQIVSVADRHAGPQVGSDVSAELLEGSKEELRKGEDNLNS